MVFACADCGKEEAPVPEKLDPALVKSVTVYNVDYETKEWQETQKTEYSYKNAYPVSVSIVYPGEDAPTVKTLKYKFENDVPVKMTFSEGKTKEYTAEYVNGRVSQISCVLPDKKKHQIQFFCVREQRRLLHLGAAFLTCRRSFRAKISVLQR